MLHQFVLIKDSRTHGVGLFALRAIPKSGVVWYLDHRHSAYSEDEILVQEPRIQELAYQAGTTFIVLEDGGQYMNHSCDPNVGWLNDTYMIALRTIYPGEELTFDYATCEINPLLRGAWECRCGAANCRQIISPADCLNPEFQARYQGRLPSWVKEYIQQHSLSNGHRHG